jgi:hypothetical protein
VKLIVTLGMVVIAGSLAAWATAIPASTIEQPASDAGVPAIAMSDTVALAASASRLRARDPFRVDRKPAQVLYNPWQPVVTTPPPPPPVRPPLALAGLVGGPPWNALIVGIPGREGGVLLQLGDSANGVRFVALRGDTAILAAFDTTWALTARRAWH